jgi:divalent metal cation (Fe/Co/Zn/Cd) transporter
VLAVALVFDGVSFSLAFRGLRSQLSGLGWWRSLRQTKDPTLFTVLLEVSTALAGIAVALAGLLLYQLLGLAVFDAAASIIIGLLLGVMAVLLAIESRSLLLGEAASLETQRRIRDAIIRQPEVTGIVDMLTMHLSPQEILVAIELNLKDGLTTDQIEMTVDRVEAAVRQVVPEATRIFVECEPLRRVRPSRTSQ